MSNGWPPLKAATCETESKYFVGHPRAFVHPFLIRTQMDTLPKTRQAGKSWWILQDKSSLTYRLLYELSVFFLSLEIFETCKVLDALPLCFQL